VICDHSVLQVGVGDTIHSPLQTQTMQYGF